MGTGITFWRQRTFSVIARDTEHANRSYSNPGGLAFGNLDSFGGEGGIDFNRCRGMGVLMDKGLSLYLAVRRKTENVLMDQLLI